MIVCVALASAGEAGAAKRYSPVHAETTALGPMDAA